ncbi:MAG: peptidoglycan DD-metalloendopeptidase family protein [Candidatus Magasanikbacteria bacterium]|nr:peptidoglycan DD-metalloendopeptidase family protein [Candidatus Magasanikbacteria bacterium]
MSRRFFYSFFALVLGFGLLFGGHSFVLAEDAGGSKEEIDALNQEIAKRKDTIKQLEQTIETYKQNIVKKQTEAVSLKNQLSILDNHVAQIETDIALTKEKIKETQLEIDALSLSIADKEKSIAKQKKIIATMVENIQAGDQKNYLEILLSYDNFSDFYNEMKNTESLYIDLGRSVKTLRLAKEELAVKKQQVEGKRAAYQALQAELEIKKEQLMEQSGVKQKLLADTKFSEARFQTLLSSLKQQYQVVENEVRTFEEKVSKKLSEENKIKESGDVVMSWPVPSRLINATFHDPDYPFRRVFEHSGIDIKAPQGTPVKAAASGYVGRARRCTLASCYSYVLLVHTGNISSLYGHLSGIAVADDAFVNRGDVIGYTGGTPGTVGAGPFVTGPHLHFEVRLNGIPVDPMGYLVQ